MQGAAARQEKRLGLGAGHGGLLSDAVARGMPAQGTGCGHGLGSGTVLQCHQVLTLNLRYYSCQHNQTPEYIARVKLHGKRTSVVFLFTFSCSYGFVSFIQARSACMCMGLHARGRCVFLSLYRFCISMEAIGVTP